MLHWFKKPEFIGVLRRGIAIAQQHADKPGMMIVQLKHRTKDARLGGCGYRISARLGLFAFIVCATTVVSAQPVISTNALVVPALPGSTAVAFSLFRVLGALAIVLAVFFGGVWLFRNWQRTAIAKGHAPKLNILETKSLGQRHAIYVIGYEQQRLLIAASPAGVTMLTTLPTASVNATEEVPTGKTPFSDALRQALQRKP